MILIVVASVIVFAVLGFRHGRRRGDVWIKPPPNKVVRVETFARSSDFETILKQAEADAAQVVRDNGPSRR